MQASAPTWHGAGECRGWRPRRPAVANGRAFAILPHSQLTTERHTYGYHRQIKTWICGADDSVGHRRGDVPGRQQRGGTAPCVGGH